MWVSTDAFGEAPLCFGRMTDFPADEGATELKFVKEKSGMSKARKAGERFRSPELMALTGWFACLTPCSKETLRVNRPPSPDAQPAVPASRGTFVI